VIALSRDQHDWGFASGRVSVLEGRLVTTEFHHSLVALEQSDDLLHRLQETQMREYLVPGATWEDWSAITDTYFCDHVASLRKDCPEPTVSDLFALSNDYINLKRALLNLGSYPMACGSFPEGLLASVAAGGLGSLPREVREPLSEFSSGFVSDPNARLALDIVLDGAYLRQVLALGDKLGVPLIRSWLSEMTLARAAVALWRAARGGTSLRLYQQYFLPVGEHTAVLGEMIGSGEPQNWGAIIPGAIGDLWLEAQQVDDDEQIMRFGVLMYNRLTAVARRGRLQTMGPERVFGYLWGLLVEIYNLKLIITGRLNGIDPDLLRRRLREAYV
jgi:V/A-type H+-transporting ATPase subunit C